MTALPSLQAPHGRLTHDLIRFVRILVTYPFCHGEVVGVGFFLTAFAIETINIYLLMTVKSLEMNKGLCCLHRFQICTYKTQGCICTHYDVHRIRAELTRWKFLMVSALWFLVLICSLRSSPLQREHV